MLTYSFCRLSKVEWCDSEHLIFCAQNIQVYLFTWKCINILYPENPQRLLKSIDRRRWSRQNGFHHTPRAIQLLLHAIQIWHCIQNFPRGHGRHIITIQIATHPGVFRQHHHLITNCGWANQACLDRIGGSTKSRPQVAHEEVQII